MPNTTSSTQKRQAVIEYFSNTDGWITIRELANYLGTAVQTARYYANNLTDTGVLEKIILNVKGSDGIVRPTSHYRRSKSIKRFGNIYYK